MLTLKIYQKCIGLNWNHFQPSRLWTLINLWVDHLSVTKWEFLDCAEWTLPLSQRRLICKFIYFYARVQLIVTWTQMVTLSHQDLLHTWHTTLLLQSWWDSSSIWFLKSSLLWLKYSGVIILVWKKVGIIVVIFFFNYTLM